MADFGKLIGSAQTIIGAGTEVKAAIDKLTGKPQPEAGSATGSINAFRSSVIGQGLMRNNRFLVQMSKPNLFYANDSALFVDAVLPFVCEAANLPGISIATSEVRRHGIGPIEKRPYSTNLIDINFTFLVDNEGIVLKFFKEWINGIVRYDTLVTNGDDRPVPQPYEVEYRSEYVSDIEILMYNEAMQQVYKVTLYNAFPIYVGDVPLNWGSTDDYIKLPVSFSYTTWASDFIDLPGAGKSKSPSAMEKLYAAGAALSLLASIRKPKNVGDLLNVVNNSTNSVSGLTKVFK